MSCQLLSVPTQRCYTVDCATRSLSRALLRDLTLPLQPVTGALDADSPAGNIRWVGPSCRCCWQYLAAATALPELLQPPLASLTMVGTKPTVFPAICCFLENARISSLLVNTGMVRACCCCTAAAMLAASVALAGRRRLCSRSLAAVCCWTRLLRTTMNSSWHYENQVRLCPTIC